MSWGPEVLEWARGSVQAKEELAVGEWRRICWPDPDATCLEGGCGHCNDHPFRSVAVIERWVRNNPATHNRHGDQVVQTRVAFMYGRAHEWNNAEVRKT